jgi:hypothetical protein
MKLEVGDKIKFKSESLMREGADNSVGWGHNMEDFADTWCTVSEIYSSENNGDYICFSIMEDSRHWTFSSLMIEEIVGCIDEIADRILNLLKDKNVNV